MSDRESAHLERFVKAQADTYASALSELRCGKKQGHWMWFIFPQIHGLGHSFMSMKYAIANRAEAEAYMNHHILGPRLVECSQAVRESRPISVESVFGATDSLKFRSCMTLFEQAAPGESEFTQALDELCGGVRDDRTIAILGPRAR